MENKEKAETFIGFAVRARAYRIGVNAIYTLKKVNLLIVCFTAGDDTKRQAEKLAKRFKCPLYATTEKTLAELVHRENAKLMAVTDKAIAKAITENNGKVLEKRNIESLREANNG